MPTRPDLSFFRARVAWVLGFSGCCAAAAAACGPKSTAAGLLVVPTTAASSSADAAADAPRDAGTDGPAVVYRPFPDDARGRRGSCDPEVTCTPALDQAPAWSYAPPFDKCGPSPNERDGEGSFSPTETLARRKTEGDACCYVKLDCASGGRVRSQVVPGRPRRGAAPEAAPCGKWTAMARMELASVDAFLDFESDLRAHGAPKALRDAALAAANDEALHARLCLDLAARHGEVSSAMPSRRPGPPGSASEEELVRSTFLDGCVNEQLAAASLRAAAARAASEDERRILLRISDEEQGHAELSWAALRWLVATKPGARDALRSALTVLRLRGAPADVLLLDERAGAALAYAMLESVVMPAAYALIAA